MKYLISLLALTFVLKAEVLQLFDTTKNYSNDQLYLKADYFIANDPVSLKEFFDKWEKEYHPRKGSNLALQDFRIDVGAVVSEKYYLGVYHRYNVFIKTNRDFADFYRTAKNKLPFDEERTYELELKIDGIQESGILLSRHKIFHDDEEDIFIVGGALRIGVGHDMQKGYISGNARVITPKSYEIDAHSSYYYTHNYLYHLDVDKSNGLGVGADMTLFYANKFYKYDIRLSINDLFSRIYWFDLPYSYVNIVTKNKYYDEDGYVKYNPSISGVEKYVNHTQTIAPRYELLFRKSFISGLSLSSILAYGYDTFFPSFKVEKGFYQNQKISLTYDTRFQSWGLGYANALFRFNLVSDALSHPSALGFQLSVDYNF